MINDLLSILFRAITIREYTVHLSITSHARTHY